MNDIKYSKDIKETVLKLDDDSDETVIEINNRSDENVRIKKEKEAAKNDDQ